MWLSQQLTKGQQRWNFLRLEEAVNYQYAYGDSTDVVRQAGRLVKGWRSQRPFQQGNDACGFAGLIAFLRANGHDLDLTDDTALAWVRGVWQGGDAAEAIQAKLMEAHLHLQHGVPPFKAILTAVMEEFPQTLAALLADEEPVPIGNFSSSRLTAELS